jgi:hypothetical protein
MLTYGSYFRADQNIPLTATRVMLADLRLFGMNPFELFDFLSSNLLLPLGGILICSLRRLGLWPAGDGPATGQPRCVAQFLAGPGGLLPRSLRRTTVDCRRVAARAQALLISAGEFRR